MAEGNGELNFSQHYIVAVQRSEEGERLRGVLLGQVSPERLLLGGLASGALSSGDRVIVRTVREGKAWGFESVVREVLEQPLPLYFLDLPAAMETIGLRKSQRLPVFIPSDVRAKAAGSDGADTLLLKGTILDLSAGGCRLFTRRKIEPATPLSLSFSLPGEKEVHLISGAVLDTFVHGSVFGQRVKFSQTEANLTDLSAIRQWINQNMVFAEG